MVPLTLQRRKRCSRRGRGAAQRGAWQEACNAFAESERLDPGAGTLMNWATCEAHQHKLTSAWQHFNEAAALLKPGDDRAGFVHAQIRKLSPRLPHLIVRLPSDAPSGTQILRNGSELGSGSLGVPLAVDPGDVELLVKSPGRQTGHSTVVLHEGDQLEIAPELGASLTAAPDVLQAHNAPTSATPQALQRQLRVSFLALGSLGVGLGLASGFVVAERKNTTDVHCPATHCDDAGSRAAASGERWLTVNTVAWSLGAAAFVGGATLLFIAPDQKREASLQPLVGGASVVYAERY